MTWLFNQMLRRRNIGRSGIRRSEKIYRKGCEDLWRSQMVDVSQPLSFAKNGPTDKQNSKVEGIIFILVIGRGQGKEVGAKKHTFGL